MAPCPARTAGDRSILGVRVNFAKRRLVVEPSAIEGSFPPCRTPVESQHAIHHNSGRNPKSADTRSAMLDGSAREINDAAAARDGVPPPLFDAAGALERLDGDIELFRVLIDVFQEDSVQLFDQLLAGHASGDIAQVARAAHTLKGLAANFNAAPAIQVAAVIEEAAHAGDAERAALHSAELGRQLAQLRAALAQWLAS